MKSWQGTLRSLGQQERDYFLQIGLIPFMKFELYHLWNFTPSGYYNHRGRVKGTSRLTFLSQDNAVLLI